MSCAQKTSYTTSQTHKKRDIFGVSNRQLGYLKPKFIKKKNYFKDYMAHRRAKQKRKKEELEASTLTPKPVSTKYPLTWQQYREHFPDSNFQDFLQEKQDFEKKHRGSYLKPEIKQIIDEGNFPVLSNDCIRFRLQIAGFSRQQKDPFFCAGHHDECESCTAWYHLWKNLSKGCNPWGSSN